jgi:uncharacterized protein (UPF0264 family)
MAIFDSNGAFPKLLVSVRNADEARAALEGGCAILDVKDPARGSLGMASIAEINAVLKTRDRHAPGTPVSVALGEVVDWEGTDTSGPGRIRDTIPPGIDFVKLGTAGLGSDSRWSSRFRRIGTPGHPTGEKAAPEWVAVAYADWTSAQAPAPREVVSAAGECGCRGVLIDTFAKEGPGLFGCLTVDDLQELARLARGRNLWLALAGRLSVADLPRVCDIAPDVVGIRSAACRGSRRDAAIDPAAIRAFQHALRDAYAVRSADR